MSVSNYIPTQWHAALLTHYNKAHVFKEVMNRDYEGTIRAHGDTVKITSVGDFTVKDYTRNAGMGGTGASPTIAEIDRPEIGQLASQFLSISQLKYLSFGIDNVDKVQAAGDLWAAYMERAGYNLADTCDRYCASVIQTGVAGTGDGNGNRLDARTVGTGAGDAEMYKVLVDLGVKLDENNVPPDGRWAVVPPWAKAMLLLDDRFTNFGTPENKATLRNGLIGEAAGFMIKVSNNLSGATSGTLAVPGGPYTVLAGIKGAATFAEQIDNPVAYTPERGFSDAMKIQHVYGAQVTRPYALASCAITLAA